MQVPVPSRGDSITAFYVSETGGDSLTVTHSKDGVIQSLTDHDQHSEGSSSTVTAPAAYDRCNDYSYSSWGHSWNRSVILMLANVDHGRPANISASDMSIVVDQAAARTTAGANSCGIGTSQGRMLVIDGPTSRSSNINGATNACASAGDGRNVVDFGNLSGTTLALTCSRSSGGIAIESDVRFDNTSRTWVTSANGCTSGFDLHSLASHEFGHVFGMGHATERDLKGDLMMSPNFLQCDTSARLMGLGDVTSWNYKK